MRPVGLLLLLDSARPASSHASYMTSSYCSTSLSAGTTIMGSAAVSSSDRTVSFDEASCGGTYTPGASLTARIDTTSGQYVIEVSGGSFDSGSCSGARTTTDESTVTAPTDGSDLVLWAGWATSYGAVSISSTCTLTAPPDPTGMPSPAPTSAPIPTPTAAPTAAPTGLPIPAPTVAPGDPTALPVPAPTAFFDMSSSARTATAGLVVVAALANALLLS